MDQELIAYLDQRFRESNEHTANLREEMTRQIASLREETFRRFDRTDEAIRYLRMSLARDPTRESPKKALEALGLTP